MGSGLFGMRALEASEGERSEPEGAGRALKAVDSEVLERPGRRRFTAGYKLRILQEADQSTEFGQIGRLLRREGLYSSNLRTWRRQRERGVLEGLTPKKRGRRAKAVDPRDGRICELERENERLRRRLEKAGMIIEFQKKISEILGIPLREDS